MFSNFQGPAFQRLCPFKLRNFIQLFKNWLCRTKPNGIIFVLEAQEFVLKISKLLLIATTFKHFLRGFQSSKKMRRFFLSAPPRLQLEWIINLKNRYNNCFILWKKWIVIFSQTVEGPNSSHVECFTKKLSNQEQLFSCSALLKPNYRLLEKKTWLFSFVRCNTRFL